MALRYFVLIFSLITVLGSADLVAVTKEVRRKSPVAVKNISYSFFLPADYIKATPASNLVREWHYSEAKEKRRRAPQKLGEASLIVANDGGLKKKVVLLSDENGSPFSLCSFYGPRSVDEVLSFSLDWVNKILIEVCREGYGQANVISICLDGNIIIETGLVERLRFLVEYYRNTETEVIVTISDNKLILPHEQVPSPLAPFASLCVKQDELEKIFLGNLIIESE